MVVDEQIYQKAVLRDDGWWDIAKCWDDLKKIGELRHKQKDKFRSTRAWNEKSHVIGIMGEFVVSLETKLPFDDELRLLGDGRKDFLDCVDVKCATFIMDPDLKHPMNDRSWPEYFVLVVLDQQNKKAKLMGWASGQQMRDAPIKNYGYGPQRAINWSKLNEGLPPIFETDVQ